MAVTIPLGLVVLGVGQVSARIGAFALPFDPHHIVTQALGAALLLLGLTRWR